MPQCKTCLQRVFNRVIVKNFIYKEKYESHKIKECKRRDRKIELAEEIKNNIRQYLVMYC